MIIAGITGGIGHGKTTFADLLAKQAATARHFESWEVVAEVASLLKDTPATPVTHDIESINGWLLSLPDIIGLQMHIPVTFSDLKLTPEKLQAHPEWYEKLFQYLELAAKQPDDAAQDITQDNKEVFRSLLQWLGGYLVICCGSGIWYDEIMRRVNRLHSSGVDLVTIGGVRFPADAERVRNANGNILQITRPDIAERDSKDLTERERDQIQPDAHIINNGTLADLAQIAVQVFTDLSVRQLKAEYRATPQEAYA